MMHPEHRIKSCCSAWAHVAREICVVDCIVKGFQTSSLSGAVATLRGRSLSKGLVLGENVVEQCTLTRQDRAKLSVKGRMVTFCFTGSDRLIVVLTDRG